MFALIDWSQWTPLGCATAVLLVVGGLVVMVVAVFLALGAFAVWADKR